MSAEVIDRHLKPHSDARYPQVLGTTKPSHFLRSAIPVRTAMDGLPPGPGFSELETVGHCGYTAKGEYLRTVTATDPVTGWTLFRAIRNNAPVNVKAGDGRIRKRSPVPILGIDFDNGSEFPNRSVIAWSDKRDIPSFRADKSLPSS